MINISKNSRDFIENYVLCNMGYTKIEEDNIAEIVNYIIDNFEVPLAQAKEAGDIIDEVILKTASDVVTEITSQSDW